jgi:ankyrin repeat protein
MEPQSKKIRFSVHNEALLYAIRRGDAAGVIKLLDAGADVNQSWQTTCERTPLSEAIKRGRTKIAFLLIDRGADINYVDKHNLTPLHYATLYGTSLLTRVLLKQDVNLKYHGREAPLTLALQNRNMRIAWLLVRAGVNIYVRDYFGKTVLGTIICACGSRMRPIEKKIMRYFIDHGIDINAPDSFGWVPIADAILMNNIEAARTLLRHRASLENLPTCFSEFHMHFDGSICRGSFGRTLAQIKHFQDLMEQLIADYPKILYKRVLQELILHPRFIANLCEQWLLEEDW